MKAGFARERITPPLGTTMMGFGTRDMDHGCDSVHDDIHVRALYLEHDDEPALILAYDLCFLGREDSDRLKGALGNLLDLAPRQILLNTSHNHVGPSVGTWYSAGYEAPDRFYLEELQAATLNAAVRARDAARDAALRVGATRSSIPMNRRRRNEQGQIENRPNPGGKVYDKLPVLFFEDRDGQPLCLAFSISCHPSMIDGHAISAEYPGAAMRILDEHFGAPVSLFLQGVGGDAKPSTIGQGVDRWKRGTWDLMDETGRILANETLAALDDLEKVKPHLKSAIVESHWPLEPVEGRARYERLVAETPPEKRDKNVEYLWAQRQLQLLDRRGSLPTSAPILIQGIQLARDVRIVAIEGEPVAPWGDFVESFYGNGLTIPLGYANGQGMYLPMTYMLKEGGYEVISSWEYGFPTRLAPGMESHVRDALATLRTAGIT